MDFTCRKRPRLGRWLKFVDYHMKMKMMIIISMIVMTFVNVCCCYGYDAFNSCSPNNKQTRKGRAQILAAIPCDLTVQTYCAMPGSAYPWNAVRRFVHENQGLMRRMYGDIKHIAILKNEILNNEIDVNDIELASDRYTRDNYQRSAKFQQPENQIDHDRYNDNDDNDDNNDDNKSKKVTIDKSENVNEKAKTVFGTLTAISTPAATLTLLSAIEQDEYEKDTTTTTTTTTEPSTTIMNNLQTTNETMATVTATATAAVAPTTTTTTTTVTKMTSLLLNRTALLSTGEPKIPSTTASSSSSAAASSAALLTSTINDEFQLKSKQTNNTTATASLPTLFNGENIEIIESPNLVSLTKQTNATTGTAPARKAATKTTIAAAAATTTTTKMQPLLMKSNGTTTLTERPTIMKQRKPPTYVSPYSSPFTSGSSTLQRYRPSSHNLYKYNSTISAKLKLKFNLTDFTTVAPTATATVNATIKLKSSTIKYNHNQNNVTTTTTKTNNNNNNNNGKINHNHYINKYGSGTLQSSSSSSSSSSSYYYTPLISASAGLSSLSTNMGMSNDFLLGNEKQRKPVVTNLTPTQAPIKSSGYHEGQLYQDTVKHDLSTIAANMRGVNACPIKEEVVAPFWANNTRGEILALLNLYPFEQYVHWEKCTNEHKQMYCRDGCRCEQQYRLHRLLAYDPHNECRGIFSDWFRFPSCCICKCYNVPSSTYDFRTTSRSPRNEWSTSDHDRNQKVYEKHPLDLAEEFVKNAIYQYATEDWYRPPTNDYHLL